MTFLQTTGLAQTLVSKCGHGDYAEKAGDAVGTKTQRATKATRKTRNAPSKPRRFGSKSRYRPSKPFVQQFTPVKENEEIEVVIDDIGSRGDGI